MDPEDVLTRPADLPDAVVRYAAHEHALVDLHLPPDTTSTSPLVVLVHGGFWQAEYDRVHLRPLANALAAEGLVVASVEYRRVGNGGGWPTTFEDISAAMKALPALLTGLDIRTSTTTVVGHSAGGHLALWLAGEDVDIDRVVALAPVSSLRRSSSDAGAGGLTIALMGGTPEEVPERYAAADPATRFEEQPSCDVVVVHGTEDALVPVRSSRGFTKHFPFIEFHELEGVDHFGPIDPQSVAWPVVLCAITDEAEGLTSD